MNRANNSTVRGWRTGERIQRFLDFIRDGRDRDESRISKMRIEKNVAFFSLLHVIMWKKVFDARVGSINLRSKIYIYIYIVEFNFCFVGDFYSSFCKKGRRSGIRYSTLEEQMFPLFFFFSILAFFFFELEIFPPSNFHAFPRRGWNGRLS